MDDRPNLRIREYLFRRINYDFRNAPSDWNIFPVLRESEDGRPEYTYIQVPIEDKKLPLYKRILLDESLLIQIIGVSLASLLAGLAIYWWLSGSGEGHVVLNGLCNIL